MSNKRTLVSAKYIGDKEIGYTPNKTYTISVYQNAAGIIIVMPIQTNFEAKLTSYDTLGEFLKNWIEITCLK